jgi:hypothetical protein
MHRWKLATTGSGEVAVLRIKDDMTEAAVTLIEVTSSRREVEYRRNPERETQRLQRIVTTG